jgi:hypothetical protein
MTNTGGRGNENKKYGQLPIRALVRGVPRFIIFVYKHIIINILYIHIYINGFSRNKRINI